MGCSGARRAHYGQIGCSGATRAHYGQLWVVAGLKGLIMDNSKE